MDYDGYQNGWDKEQEDFPVQEKVPEEQQEEQQQADPVAEEQPQPEGAARNYYDERYRGPQDRYREFEQYDRTGGFGAGVPDGGKKPKKGKGGRIAAAVLLAVLFIGFCGGISWVAVNSLEQYQEAPEDEIADAEEETPGLPPEEESDAAKDQEEAADPVSPAAPVPNSISGTAVVTDVTDVVERVMPACVSITNNFTQKVQDFWGQTYSRDAQGSGSGIIIGQNDTELLIVSNNHVVDSADSLQVQFIDGEIVQAQIKGVDSSADLAVVAVNLTDIPEKTRNAIVVAQMGDSGNLKIGEPAIAIGNALGYGQSVTTGVISAVNRTLQDSESGESNAMIQTDAAINPGNSGGALLNIRGEVIGINSSKNYGSAIEGMGYAIPISTARPIIDELMTRETRAKLSEKDHGYLGISCINVTSELSENFAMPEGVFVALVYEGTGADRAGLVRGDIITAINGVTVANQDELNTQTSYYKAGETVELTIMQGSPTGYQARNVSLTLSTLEEVNESARQQEQEENSRNSNPFWP